MRKILLVSHGHLASGLKSSIQILTGDASSVSVIDAYVDDSDFTKDIRSFIANCEPKDGAIIFTDILGGSVFQKVALEHPESKGVIHVTGMNLAAVMECLLSPEELTKKTVDDICKVAASQLKRIEITGSSEEGGGEEEEFFN